MFLSNSLDRISLRRLYETNSFSLCDTYNTRFPLNFHFWLRNRTCFISFELRSWSLIFYFILSWQFLNLLLKGVLYVINSLSRNFDVYFLIFLRIFNTFAAIYWLPSFLSVYPSIYLLFVCKRPISWLKDTSVFRNWSSNFGKRRYFSFLSLVLFVTPL